MDCHGLSVESYGYLLHIQINYVVKLEDAGPAPHLAKATNHKHTTVWLHSMITPYFDSISWLRAVAGKSNIWLVGSESTMMPFGCLFHQRGILQWKWQSGWSFQPIEQTIVGIKAQNRSINITCYHWMLSSSVNLWRLTTNPSRGAFIHRRPLQKGEMHLWWVVSLWRLQLTTLQFSMEAHHEAPKRTIPKQEIIIFRVSIFCKIG